MEELLAKHRKEQRDLQGRITNKKKNATKKSRKGVNDECENLEREMKERQKAEVEALSGIEGPTTDQLEALNLDDPKDGASEPVSDTATARVIEEENAKEKSTESKKVTFNVAEPLLEPEVGTSRAKKPNRQKARLARRAEEQAAASDAAALEAANMPDRREQEIRSMQKQIKAKGFQEISIRPDGHCLYSACAHSLPHEKVKQSGPYTLPYQNIRFTASNFISSHKDDFEPFLEEPFEAYVRKIKDTAEWGGQLELQAIAKAYGVDINVLRADGSVTNIEGSGHKHSENVWLAYYEHSFGLGEHYNALRKREAEDKKPEE